MPDLNLSLDYFGHPKTNRLKGILGRGAELLPIRLWAYCGRYFAKDGRVIAHSPNEIEAVVEWWGKPGEAIEALMRVGFLDFDGETYSAHDWKRHQGHIFAMKKRNSLVAKNRWQNIKNKTKKEEKVVPTVDTSGIPRGTPDCTNGVPYTSLSSLSKPSLKTKPSSSPPEAVRLAEKLKGLIIGNNPKIIPPENLEGWANEARLMIEKDKRSIAEIEQVMEWSQKDSFWRLNILSMPKFRKQFAQLWAKMEQGGKNGFSGKPIGATPIPGKYSAFE